jgi:hypothetical protein
MSTSSGGDDSVDSEYLDGLRDVLVKTIRLLQKRLRHLEDWSAVDRIRIAALDDQIEAFAGRFAQEYEQLNERFHEFEARSRSRG